MKKIVVIGIGNEYARDDTIGLEIARGLSKLNFENMSVQESSGDCSQLMSIWERADSAVVVDALAPMGNPGAVHSFDASGAPIPAGVFSCESTHLMGLSEAIELSRTLDRLPNRLVVFGIEGKDFSPGVGLSQEVAAALERAFTQIRDEILSRFLQTSNRS